MKHRHIQEYVGSHDAYEINSKGTTFRL